MTENKNFKKLKIINKFNFPYYNFLLNYSFMSWYSMLQRKILLTDRFNVLNELINLKNYDKITKYKNINKYIDYKNINEFIKYKNNNEFIKYKNNNEFIKYKNDILSNPLYDKNYLNYIIKEEPDDLEEIIRKRIKELISKNKNMYISYSGGVDSTLIISSFIKFFPDFIKNVIILYNKYSIQEYPYMFDFLKKTNFMLRFLKSEEVIDVYKNIVNSDGIIITGDCGDQMFGSDIELSYPDYSNKSWKTFVTDNYPLAYKKYTISKIEKCLSSIPLKIEKTLDFLWLLNFCCKWEVVSNSISVYSGYDFNKNIIAFFNTKDFEMYACHYEKTSINDIKNYKLPFKKIIYSIIKDKDYFENKGKFNSLRPVMDEYCYAIKDCRLIVLNSNDSISSYNIDKNLYDEDKLRKYIKDNILLEYYNLNL